MHTVMAVHLDRESVLGKMSALASESKSTEIMVVHLVYNALGS